MSSVLRIVYLSSLTVALATGLGSLSLGRATEAPQPNAVTLFDAMPEAASNQAFTPDPSKPPVVTQGSGTR
jgi:hypothetical protein